MLKATLVKALTVAALIGAPLVVAPATASAAPTASPLQIPLVYSADIFGVCGLFGICVYNPPIATGATPGTVTVPYIGLYGGPYSVQWRNFGTGATGAQAIPFDQPTDVVTGAGPVVLTVTNERQIIAGTGIFLVP